MGNPFSHNGWSFFTNQWCPFSYETSKQIDEELKRHWWSAKSEIISFPLTRGTYFGEHAGTYFVRIGLDNARSQTVECMLMNSETGAEKPIQREPAFNPPRYKNNNQKQSFNRRQLQHHQSYDRPQYREVVKVTTTGLHGTTVQYMTPEQANYYAMVMHENACIQSGSNIPNAQTSHVATAGNGNDENQGDPTNFIINVWDYKHINDWTCNELQEWIIYLDLDVDIEKQIVEAISEQECTGADFNTMEEATDIAQSFDIEEKVADKIWNVLVNIRAKLTNAKYRPENSGIIGLKNLRNTCFINVVIQALLQTPGLIHVLRTFISNNWSLSMLDAFIEVARGAFQANSKDNSISPKGIVECLRNSDVKFSYGEQGDALSAVSKMLELLDKDMIERARQSGDKQEEHKHTGSWYADESKEFDEDELVEIEWLKYNPDKESIIRDCIHFVERNVFTCMQCGWKESRYEVKDKVLLPLQDHSMTVHVNIYIPAVKTDGPAMEYKPFMVLDYCPVATLKYQIYQEVISSKKIEVEDINQVSLCCVIPSKEDLTNKWITSCDEKENCCELVDRNIFAVVNSLESEITTVTTYHVVIDQYGYADQDQSYVEFEEMKTGTKKSFSNISKPGYPIKYIFFEKKIFDENYPCQVTDKNSTIICFWVPKEADQDFKWNKCDINTIDAELIAEIWENMDGNEPNYEDIIDFIQTKVDECSKEETTDETVEKLTYAMVTYEALKQNEKRVTFLTYKAFGNKFNYVMEKKESDHESIVDSIKDGFDTYCSPKVMDRGAVVKCGGSCGGLRCHVFKQETKIVRFPEVLIFGIDRYIFGQKFEECVGYEEIFNVHGNKYELYAVCNHNGGLEYGHYWAFVKGIDDNEWYNANDSTITTMNSSQVINQSTAILLFYKKCKSYNN